MEFVRLNPDKREVFLAVCGRSNLAHSYLLDRTEWAWIVDSKTETMVYVHLHIHDTPPIAIALEYLLFIPSDKVYQAHDGLHYWFGEDDIPLWPRITIRHADGAEFIYIGNGTFQMVSPELAKLLNRE